MNRFDYYEIRACVDFGDHTESFKGAAEYCSMRTSVIYTPQGAKAEAERVAEAAGKTVFWTLYGIDEEGHANAIGDFKTFEAAYTVMDAILTPLAVIRDLLGFSNLTPPEVLRENMQVAASRAEDILLQSSTEERL